MQDRLKKNVTDDDHNIRLDRWFRRYYPHITIAMLNKALRKNLIKYNEQKTTCSQRVEVGGVVSIAQFFLGNLQTEGYTKVRPVKHDAKLLSLLKNSILYKDEDILAINKPYGVAVQGGTKINISIDDMLEHLCFEAAIKPKLVHRLDKDTSGVLLLARNATSAAFLTNSFKEKTIKKTYFALVVGGFKPKHGEIASHIAKQMSAGKEKMVQLDKKNASKAVTAYQTIAEAEHASWIEFAPLTGQTHQLRVHSVALGAPILGDFKYGGSRAKLPGLNEKMHLHAQKIRMTNVDGKDIEITAQMPEHMQETWQKLGFGFVR